MGCNRSLQCDRETRLDILSFLTLYYALLVRFHFISGGTTSALEPLERQENRKQL